MTDNTIKARIQHLHKTEAEWNKLPDFKPNAGELIIYDVDQNYTVPRVKFGNGVDKLSDLPFVSTEISFDAGRITDYL